MKNHFEVSLHTHQSSRFHVNGKRSFDGNDQDLAEVACALFIIHTVRGMWSFQ